MIISKKEAKARGLLHSKLCLFHERGQDEAGAVDCLDCRVIRDPCGCGENDSCEDCALDSFERVGIMPVESEDHDLAMYKG